MATKHGRRLKLEPIAFAYACAALSGGSVLFVGLINLGVPGYGQEVLYLLESVYPGYHASATLGSVLVATGYALLDGAVVGWLLGWLYNRVGRARR